MFRVCNEWRGEKGEKMWKDPKVREWKYLRSMREFTMRSFSVCMGVFRTEKRIFCRKSWLWRKRVAINILEREGEWVCGAKADVFLSVFSFFEACCWLLRLAAHVFIRHKFRGHGKKKEWGKVIILKIPRERRICKRKRSPFFNILKILKEKGKKLTITLTLRYARSPHNAY